MTNHSDEDRLLDDAETLRATMARISKLLLKAAKAVRRIESQTSDKGAAALLAVWAGASEDDIQLLHAVAEFLDGNDQLVEAGVSPNTIRLLRQISDDTVRAEAVRLVESRVPVDEAKLKQLESHLNLIDKGADLIEMEEKSLWLESLAARNSIVRISDLRDQIADLRPSAEWT